MLARIRKSMDEKDQGFTLIELLVVMIIIGILAAIAIPVFLNQKKKAAETSAKSDATNIARDVAAFFVDGTPGTLAITGFNGAASTTADNSGGSSTVPVELTAGSETTDVQLGAGNTLTVSPATGVTTENWCVTVAPSQDGASEWSAGPNGLKKGTSC